MVNQDQTGTEPAHGKVQEAVPVTPSEGTQRPEGLAFDVDKDAALPGVCGRRPDCEQPWG